MNTTVMKEERNQQLADIRKLIYEIEDLRIFSQSRVNRDWGCNWELFEPFAKELESLSKSLGLNSPFSVHKRYRLADPAKMETLARKLKTGQLGRMIEAMDEQRWTALLVSLGIPPKGYDRKVKCVFFHTENPPGTRDGEQNPELFVSTADETGKLVEVTSPAAIHRLLDDKLDRWKLFLNKQIQDQEQAAPAGSGNVSIADPPNDEKPKNTAMKSKDIEHKAIALLAKRAKKGVLFQSRNELAEEVGCRPNGATIKRIWDKYGTPKQAMSAEPLPDEIEDAHATVLRLAAEQRAEQKADGRPRRIMT